MNLHDLARRLGGELARNGIVTCPGPGHSPKDRSLTVWLESDDVNVHSFAGDDWQTCKDYVREQLGLPSWEAGKGQKGRARRPTSKRTSYDDEGSRIALVRRIWREAKDPRIAPVLAYLEHRGLPPFTNDQIPVFRYHPNCPFGGEHVPALIARFSPIENDPGLEVEPTAIFRIRLDLYDGDRRKLALGPSRGQVIKLDRDISLAGLGITEGIEKGLALVASGWQPIWVTCGTSTMRNFPLLPWMECLTIFCDRDEPGRDAALVGIDRWRNAGREARALAPPAPFKDWDAWTRRGGQG
ncbi:putative DNA primase/helicase [Sinorhizobium fredii]|uniref:Virulence-associated protein E n=1 Tax=Sinorhizobium fredii (strain USDA 257) TaxID=1185652 RepID=I3WZH0_SINF2|nr:toprim domain-containing protein [Sinorhizobium fredii]AFL49026.1 virulence-associated protein E [Sinorhizobium fredii USDA 257]